MGVLQEGQTKHSFAKQVVHPAQKQTKKKSFWDDRKVS